VDEERKALKVNYTEYAATARRRNAGASAISFHKMYPGTMMRFWTDDGRRSSRPPAPAPAAGDGEDAGGGSDAAGGEGAGARAAEAEEKGGSLYRLYDRPRSYNGWDDEAPRAVDLWSL
jgi:hypothetical protein